MGIILLELALTVLEEGWKTLTEKDTLMEKPQKKEERNNLLLRSLLCEGYKIAYLTFLVAAKSI